jgi:hypothetical protein
LYFIPRLTFPKEGNGRVAPLEKRCARGSVSQKTLRLGSLKTRCAAEKRRGIY